MELKRELFNLKPDSCFLILFSSCRAETSAMATWHLSRSFFPSLAFFSWRYWNVFRRVSQQPHVLFIPNCKLLQGWLIGFIYCPRHNCPYSSLTPQLCFPLEHSHFYDDWFMTFSWANVFFFCVVRIHILLGGQSRLQADEMESGDVWWLPW